MVCVLVCELGSNPTSTSCRYHILSPRHTLHNSYHAPPTRTPTNRHPLRTPMHTINQKLERHYYSDDETHGEDTLWPRVERDERQETHQGDCRNEHAEGRYAG